jgi:hypothetical protein
MIPVVSITGEARKYCNTQNQGSVVSSLSACGGVGRAALRKTNTEEALQRFSAGWVSDALFDEASLGKVQS